MPLQAITVVIPVRLGFNEEDPLFPVQVDTVASSEKAALSTAKALVSTWCQLEHHCRPGAILTDRANITPSGQVVGGAYAYVFGTGDRIVSLYFASACQGKASLEMAQSLAGLQRPWCHGLVLDGAQLSGVDSAALSSLVQISQQLSCHICRLPSAIHRLIGQIGLDSHLNLHQDLSAAMTGLLKQTLTKHIADTRKHRAKA